MIVRRTNIAVLGTVVILQRDHRQRIQSLGLKVPDAETVVVDDSPMGDLLLDFVGEVVLARGTSHRADDGRRHVRITSFSPAGELPAVASTTLTSRRRAGPGQPRP